MTPEQRARFKWRLYMEANTLHPRSQIATATFIDWWDECERQVQQKRPFLFFLFGRVTLMELP